MTEEEDRGSGRDENTSENALPSNPEEQQHRARLKDRLDLRAEMNENFSDDDDDEEFPWRFFRKEEEIASQMQPPSEPQPTHYQQSPPPLPQQYQPHPASYTQAPAQPSTPIQGQMHTQAQGQPGQYPGQAQAHVHAQTQGQLQQGQVSGYPASQIPGYSQDQYYYYPNPQYTPQNQIAAPAYNPQLPAETENMPKRRGYEVGFAYFIIGFFVAVLMVFSAIFYLGEQMNGPRDTIRKMASSENPSGSSTAPELSTATKTDNQPQAGATPGDIAKTAGAGKFEVRNIFGLAGSPIAMEVFLPRVAPGQYAFLIFRGMPSNISFSAGERFGDSWIVPLHKIDNLSLQAPASYQGTFLLEAVLIRDEAAKPQRLTAVATIRPDPNKKQDIKKPTQRPSVVATIENSTRLNSVEGSKQQPASRQSQPSQSTNSQQNSSVAKIDQTVEQLMIDRGNKLLQEGDIAGARLLFEHLSQSNSRQGTYALASTYDPKKLDTLGVRGIEPDVNTAVQLYKRSAALGSPEASERLKALTNAKVTSNKKKKTRSLKLLFQQFLDEETAKVGVDALRSTSKQELFEKFLEWQTARANPQ